MKYLSLAILLVLLFIPSATKADSFVFVDMVPVTFNVLVPNQNNQPQHYGPVAVGATFVWDLTTNAISHVNVTSSSSSLFLNMYVLDSAMPGLLDFGNSAGDIFQMNSANHAGFIPPLTGAAGIFPTDLWFFCPSCSIDNAGFTSGEAIVIPLGQHPAPTPEPASALLLGAGFMGLVLWGGYSRCRRGILASV